MQIIIAKKLSEGEEDPEVLLAKEYINQIIWPRRETGKFSRENVLLFELEIAEMRSTLYRVLIGVIDYRKSKGGCEELEKMREDFREEFPTQILPVCCDPVSDEEIIKIYETGKLRIEELKRKSQFLLAAMDESCPKVPETTSAQ